jgi:RNA polymerase sigma-70 factor (ECF subfamily)
MSTTAETFPAADADSGVVHGRFRRRSSCDDSAERQRLVARAVERAKLGDQEALRYLYVTYADSVFGYVSSVVRDHHEAEDVTQHVFFKLMTVLPKYQQREVPFSAWILRVARNVAVDHLRQRRALPVEEVRPVDSPADDDAGVDRRMSLTEALATLPDEQREVLVLRHLMGLSPTEIADRMGRSEP